MTRHAWRRTATQDFGLLYQQGVIWNGERILSKAWIDFERTPAPATAKIGNARRTTEDQAGDERQMGAIVLEGTHGRAQAPLGSIAEVEGRPPD